MSARSNLFEVIVVGGGPAGSVMAWLLAKQGKRVALLERTAFPRHKVCGDFVEPGGLRILSALGVLSELETQPRLKITRNRVYFGPKLVYSGDIQYYKDQEDGINYGLVISRRELDALLFDAARRAGATVFNPGEARSLVRRGDVIHVAAQIGERSVTLRAPLVVGADGVESIVARTAGLRRTDRRHIGVAQRVYVEGVEVDEGEATVWFDEDIAPGYGWLFPMAGGLANMGVGLSSDVSQRFDISVRDTFERAIERLRIRHPGCARVRLSRDENFPGRPIGGVVKTYSGIDRNHFDGGLLIGDAGSFVDPVTGEGITHGMESAILALPALEEALARGRYEAADLARFDSDFRRYFDPAMRYLELSAALMSNRRLSAFWLRVGAHGHEEAARDPEFAGLSGSIFGGPALQPLKASAQIWTRLIARYAEAATSAGQGDLALAARFADDLRALREGWERSRAEDPDGHSAWLKDVIARAVEVQKTIWTQPNPRPAGAFRFIGLDPTDAPTPAPIVDPQTQAMIATGVRTLIEAGFSLLRAATTAPAPDTDAEPRRRWRVKP